MTLTVRIFFATDVHGSEICWRKLISAGGFYKADVVILGGDMTGKQVVPLVTQTDGTVTSDFLGLKTILRTPEEVKAHEERIRDTGYYPYHCTVEGIHELSQDTNKAEQIFKDLQIQRIRDWITLAEDKLKGSKVRLIVCPGNDDSLAIDPLLDASKLIERAEGNILDIDGHQMINSGWTNPTPWDTPRECSEEELEKKLEVMTSQLTNPRTSIFQLHSPPYGTGIDDAPTLDRDLKPIRGGTATGPVGSKSVLRVIEKFQPLLGLHGHIHESKGARNVGKTICINPGSMYSEGILQGAVIQLEKDKVKSHVFTSG